MGYAGPVKRKLSDIAVIDEGTIQQIAAAMPPTAVELTPEQIASIAAGITPVDISGKVDKITNKSLVSDTEIAKIHSLGSDDQDLSGLQSKETGKGLYPDTDGNKLAGIEANANNYTHPANHAASIITQDASNRFVTDVEKTTWNGKGSSNLVLGDLSSNACPGDKGKTAYDHSQVAHAPSNAVALTTVKTDTDVASAISLKHSNALDHNGGTQDTAIAGKNPIRLFANLTTPVASSGTTEKVLLQLMIPAARAIIGSTFRAWVVGNSSTNGTLIFRIKCGPNGSISDTEDWKSVTSVAQVANARAGFEVLITIRSATTIAVDGVGYAGAVQLPTTIAAPATPAIAISGNWYINMTVVCSSGVFTAQVGSIEEIR